MALAQSLAFVSETRTLAIGRVSNCNGKRLVKVASRLIEMMPVIIVRTLSMIYRRLTDGMTSELLAYAIDIPSRDS